jgi:hypothetical protein
MKVPLDDQEIISLYKSNATELPSSEVDRKILEYAQAQTKQKRNWWPYVGLAASVGFVAILAPWQWYEQTTYPALESDVSHMKMLSPESEISPPALQSSRESAAMSKRVVREKDQSERLELSFNRFAEVEALLAGGEQEKARSLLEQLLQDSPELRSHLPKHLQVLMEEQKQEE